jgi:hypothetical protein
MVRQQDQGAADHVAGILAAPGAGQARADGDVAAAFAWAGAVDNVMAVRGPAGHGVRQRGKNAGRFGVQGAGGAIDGRRVAGAASRQREQAGGERAAAMVIGSRCASDAGWLGWHAGRRMPELCVDVGGLALPQQGGDVFQRGGFSQPGGVLAAIQKTAVGGGGDRRRQHRIAVLHGLRGNDFYPAAAVAALGHAQHIVAMVEAAARVGVVGFGADLAPADVGVQRLRPHVEEAQGFCRCHPDHLHFLC